MELIRGSIRKSSGMAAASCGGAHDEPNGLLGWFRVMNGIND